MTREGAEVEAQGLLVPVVLELEARDAEFVLPERGELRGGGIGVESFGGNAVQVGSMPAFLGGEDARGVVEGLVDRLLEKENTGSGKAILFESFAAHFARVAARGRAGGGGAGGRLARGAFPVRPPVLRPGRAGDAGASFHAGAGPEVREAVNREPFCAQATKVTMDAK